MKFILYRGDGTSVGISSTSPNGSIEVYGKYTLYNSPYQHISAWPDMILDLAFIYYMVCLMNILDYIY